MLSWFIVGIGIAKILKDHEDQRTPNGENLIKKGCD